ncbi:MAG: hypothetical protein ABI640_01235 [Gammaproteobacteria bacterium]
MKRAEIATRRRRALTPGTRCSLSGSRGGRATGEGALNKTAFIRIIRSPDARFDFDYYVNKHMPLTMKLYGKSISRFELRCGQPGADGAAPPFVATITIWIADPKAFDAAAAIHQAGRAPTSRSSRTPI